MSRRLLWLAALLAAAPALAEPAAPISGRSRVIDGDTIDVDGRRIRLWGIDAPEGAQQCARDGRAYPCGDEAAEALAALIGGAEPRCEPRDRDRYGRTVATCYVTRAGVRVDLAAELVALGWALDFGRYSRGAYEREEREARAARRGMWRDDEIEPPWEWRRARR
ncbi:thermonuclease family protein [Rhodoplanes serenus]|uniref:thermonuclease family protein n=1 Tax=Rhodoplanes serenus TaxID=200615 RepID=UPI000DAEAA5F|nr:thermonuclease family protein [Rhodoplanes serenus]RAI32542.1 hypothetical protein CH340_15115 [Rhodoplanes serenus]